MEAEWGTRWKRQRWLFVHREADGAARCAEKRPYYLGQVEIRAENARRIPGAKPLALGIRPGRVQAPGPGVNQPPRRFVLSRRCRPPDAGRASLHKAAWQRKCLNYQRSECLFWAQKKEKRTEVLSAVVKLEAPQNLVKFTFVIKCPSDLPKTGTLFFLFFFWFFQFLVHRSMRASTSCPL